MKLQFQILSLIVLSRTTVSSESASLLSINASVGIGETLSPVILSGSVVTTAAPTTAASTTASGIHLNLTVTAAPSSSNITGTTQAPLTTVSHLNVTVPAASNLTVTTQAPASSLGNGTAAPTTTRAPSNSTMTTPKPSTKFPETCQSLDTLVQSGECYYALEGLDAEMGSSSLTDSDTIEKLNGYCTTFSTCYPAIEKCADFDPASISIIKGFCDFYQFVTSKYFLSCAQNMEGMPTPCTDNATNIILNFNATTAMRCATLTAVSSCSLEEVDTWCNLRSVQSYQMFINRNIQTWMC